jgi:hypothetical protein
MIVIVYTMHGFHFLDILTVVPYTFFVKDRKFNMSSLTFFTPCQCRQ